MVAHQFTRSGGGGVNHGTAVRYGDCTVGGPPEKGKVGKGDPPIAPDFLSSLLQKKNLLFFSSRVVQATLTSPTEKKEKRKKKKEKRKKKKEKRKKKKEKRKTLDRANFFFLSSLSSESLTRQIATPFQNFFYSSLPPSIFLHRQTFAFCFAYHPLVWSGQLIFLHA